MDTDSSEDDEEGEEAVRIPLGHRPVVFSLPGGQDLAQRTLAVLGWKQGSCSFTTFNNGEIAVKVEETVTNHDVFVLGVRDDHQAEVNFSIMQLMAFLSALKGESPHRLTVVLPCLDYSRQDRKMQAGEGIPVKLLLNLMKTAGADRFVTMDLHNEAEAGFAPADTVLDELCARKYIAGFLLRSIPGFSSDSTVVCATKGGGMALSRRMASELCAGLMIADQIRTKRSSTGELKIISSVAAEQVRNVVVVDDMFDTCSSLLEVCKALHSFVPQANLYAVATHGYFSAKAHLVIKEAVETCGLQWVGVTNSVAQAGTFERLRSVGMESRLKLVDVSRMLAGAVMRIYLGQSVNLPKFRELGPYDEDPVLHGAKSPSLLTRRSTDDGTIPALVI